MSRDEQDEQTWEAKAGVITVSNGEVEEVEDDYPDQVEAPHPGETYEMPPDDPFQIPIDPTTMRTPPKPYIAFELRKAGASYEQIAEKVGYKNPRSAENAVLRFLHHRTYDDKEQLRKLEIERLDALQLIAWRLAKEGHLGAIDRILKIMEVRRVYAGIEDTTHIHQQAVFIGGSHEEYVEALKRLRSQAT